MNRLPLAEAYRLFDTLAATKVVLLSSGVALLPGRFARAVHDRGMPELPQPLISMRLRRNQ